MRSRAREKTVSVRDRLKIVAKFRTTRSVNIADSFQFVPISDTTFFIDTLIFAAR
jgi:hypothetical protein